jgi:uncharacterized phage protein (TIGR02220 family)
MANVHWFKHYTGMTTDDKFKKIRRRIGVKVYPLFMMWSRVLERAAKDGGWFRESKDVAHTPESLDVVFEDMVDDYGVEIIDLFFLETIKERLITKDVVGFYYVNNWEEYQHAALSTPRVQESRERKQIKTESYRTKIRARFNDGYSKEDMVAVIHHKLFSWRGTKHEQYLTPDTLFRPGHFDRYLNEIPADKKQAMDSGTLLHVENIYGHKSHISEKQFKAAEPDFYHIVK